MVESASSVREIFIEKIIVNIGVGEAGDRLVKAEQVLAQLTQAKPVRTRASKSVRDWNVRAGMEIGVKVTLRGEAAERFLREALDSRGNKIADYSFDQNGNLSFGVTDHTEFTRMKYDPDIGIFGMDVAVVFKRIGGRVRTRRIRPAAIGRRQRVTRDDAVRLMRETFQAEVL